MHTRFVDGVTIRPLRPGDAATVAAVFDRLGPRSRERRVREGGDLAPGALARGDADRHVLVAWVDGDAAPAAVAWLVRDGTSAEMGSEVADDHRGRGLGAALARELAADARAAGVTELVATECRDDPREDSLLHRIAGSLLARRRGGEREPAVGLPGPATGP
jgi:GNAT superfamily N-acetyltransferase